MKKNSKFLNLSLLFLIIILLLLVFVKVPSSLNRYDTSLYEEKEDKIVDLYGAFGFRINQPIEGQISTLKNVSYKDNLYIYASNDYNIEKDAPANVGYEQSFISYMFNGKLLPQKIDIQNIKSRSKIISGMILLTDNEKKIISINKTTLLFDKDVCKYLYDYFSKYALKEKYKTKFVYEDPNLSVFNINDKYLSFSCYDGNLTTSLSTIDGFRKLYYVTEKNIKMPVIKDL